MGTLSVYNTDSNPKHLYSSDGVERSADMLLKQLTRASGHPVDLFVDVSGERLIWNFKAISGDGTRDNYFMLDYRSDDEPGALFTGLRQKLHTLRTEENWEFPTLSMGGEHNFASESEPRWAAGFKLDSLDPMLPGLAKADQDAFIELLEKDWPQVAFGMSSYESALMVVRFLYAEDIDCTVAINSQGTTSETDHVDLVLWPGANQDFIPLNQETQDILSKREFVSLNDATVVDEGPSQELKVTDDHRAITTENVTNLMGRLSLGLIIVLFGIAVAGIASVGPMQGGLSGLGTFAGLLTALSGRIFLPRINWELISKISGGLINSADAAYSAVFDFKSWNWKQNAIYTSYFMLFGYMFLGISWPVTHSVIGNPWVFIPNGLPGWLLLMIGYSVIYYGVILNIVSVAAFLVLHRLLEGKTKNSDILRLVVLNGTLVVWLVLLVGPACLVWQHVIPIFARC